MTVESTAKASPRLKARIAGLLYLVVIAGGIFAEIFVRGRLIVSGDAAATAHNIMSHELLYRLGFAVELFYCACNVPLILLLYDLFKIVNRSAAVLMVFFSLVGTAIEGVSLLCDFAPLLLLGGTPSLSALKAEQLQAMAYLSLQLFERGFAIALVFFGLYCFAIAYLILRSTFFPRIVGMLLAIEGLFYLINSFSTFVAPGFAARFFPFLAASGVAEILLCLCLLIVGVNVQRWKEQASAA